MNIPELEDFVDIKHVLLPVGTWRESVHVFDERTAQAIRAALASGRPLLVRGEPGTGKSQLARAAAKVLGRKFLSHVVDAHTEIQDLWYRFDAVTRLGNAQVLSAIGKEKTDEQIDQMLSPEEYLSPGILWWAFDWKDASSKVGKHPFFIPDENDPGDEINGTVLLLDEIDKADADLPNSLLETLDNGQFTVPWIKKTVGVAQGELANRPLVVLTTNEDRQLPGAFVRRCLVLDLQLPKEKNELIRKLKERAVFHFPVIKAGETERDTEIRRDEDDMPLQECRLHEDVLQEAADQLFKDRLEANSLGVTPPGQAEYLDMLRVLDELVPDDTEQQKVLLKTIKDFALKKYPGMQKQQVDSKAQNRKETPEENEASE